MADGVFLDTAEVYRIGPTALLVLSSILRNDRQGCDKSDSLLTSTTQDRSARGVIVIGRQDSDMNKTSNELLQRQRSRFVRFEDDLRSVKGKVDGRLSQGRDESESQSVQAGKRERSAYELDAEMVCQNVPTDPVRHSGGRLAEERLLAMI